ncbi:MAG: tetratricopeptide repeat protein [Deltaproteobacteria bacterium]|nr:MAG: tetratricopeptide repeat protein [Deltaproteobacteria bacterium]
MAAILIAAATIGVYWNTLGNEFLTFDDRKYIYENTLVTGNGGLQAIWGDVTNDKPRLHYYPMTFTTFWIEYSLVGLEPPDADPARTVSKRAHPLYHWTQMSLHAINAGLVLFALYFLGVRYMASVFTAAFFALHPVNVASVAWMAERKSLVSGLFLWLTLLLYCFYRRRSAAVPANARGKVRWFYGATILGFTLALCSKAASLVLAPVLIVTDRVLDRRWSWASVFRCAPFFLLGLIMAGITSAREAHIAKSWEPIDVWLRPFIAVSSLVHYVGKMLLPVKQAIIYPRWAESLLEPRYWISLAIFVAAAILIRRYREWLGDHWLWGLALYLLTVAPVLGLKHFIWTQFAFVSDHYMYYGSPGILLMIGLLLERWCREKDPSPGDGRAATSTSLKQSRVVVVGVLSVLGLAACGWRTVQQNRTWHDNAALWTHTLTVSSDCFLANMNLGNHYSREGNDQRALELYRECTRIRPDFAHTWRSSARKAGRLGLVDEAIGRFKNAVAAAEAKNPWAWSIQVEYADYLSSLGRLEEALVEYETVLQKEPPEASKIKAKADRVRLRVRNSTPPETPTAPRE